MLSFYVEVQCLPVLGVGAISYVEYARRLLPDPGESDTEINNLTAAMIPGMIYFYFKIM